MENVNLFCDDVNDTKSKEAHGNKISKIKRCCVVNFRRFYYHKSRIKMITQLLSAFDLMPMKFDPRNNTKYYHLNQISRFVKKFLTYLVRLFDYISNK